MNNLDDDLRETLRRHAPDPDSLRPLEWTPGPAHRAPSGPRRLLVPAFAAVFVLVFVVAVGAFVVTRDPTSSAPVNPIPTQTPTPTMTRSPSALGGNSKATGTQKVYYRGVMLRVHRSLVLDAFECGGPVEATVVIGTAPTECDGGPHGGIADAPIVKLLPSESGEGATLAAEATTPVTINGFDGFTDCDSCGDGTFEEGAHLYLPEQKVVLVAEVFGTGGYTNEVFHTLSETHGVANASPNCSSEAPPVAPAASDVVGPPFEGARLAAGRICVYGSSDAPGGKALLLAADFGASTAEALVRKLGAAAPDPAAATGIACLARWGPSEAVVQLEYSGTGTDGGGLFQAFRKFHVWSAAPGCVEVSSRAGQIVSATGFGVEDLLDLRF